MFKKGDKVRVVSNPVDLLLPAPLVGSVGTVLYTADSLFPKPVNEYVHVTFTTPTVVGKSIYAPDETVQLLDNEYIVIGYLPHELELVEAIPVNPVPEPLLDEALATIVELAKQIAVTPEHLAAINKVTELQDKLD